MSFCEVILSLVIWAYHNMFISAVIEDSETSSTVTFSAGNSGWSLYSFVMPSFAFKFVSQTGIIVNSCLVSSRSGYSPQMSYTNLSGQ